MMKKLKTGRSSRVFMALAVVLLFVGGNLLYRWHVHRTPESERPPPTQRDREFRGRQEKPTETRPAEPVNVPKETESLDSTSEITVSEDEKAAEALAAERVPHIRKSLARARELFKETGKILAAASSPITAQTHPEETRQLLEIKKELKELEGLMKEAPPPFPAEDKFSFEYRMELSRMHENGTNAHGELLVSEALKIADYMETEGGDLMGAFGVRLLADQALESGDDAINVEVHSEQLHQKEERLRQILEEAGHE